MDGISTDGTTALHTAKKEAQSGEGKRKIGEKEKGKATASHVRAPRFLIAGLRSSKVWSTWTATLAI